ncbi:hypothetical protein GWC95_04095 [Sediminibacterium roseum]|uniref:Glucose-methanol-choline oxidoreductase N-terminal domain-containing protein n=1 Tax=Sediminibacterium roseum TaxID=1978412 RepID=A0ABW9ZPS6_9BACT|nr:GMC family oxidoreductase N-terminal domain-containing protein [Sediminibacterium roseum]NCI49090.1 hypothetical protein [Sediminibacterium roseum]
MNNRFDYIIAGAGSAGAALAARVAENGKHSVLLIEAGGKPDNIWFKVPLGIGKLLHREKYVWKFFTEEIKGINQRRVYMPQGRILGGSSTVNGMVYVRGLPSKFDEWASNGCAGWSFKDVLPYFKRMEDFPGGDPAYRGVGGPFKITEIKRRDVLSEAFRESCLQAGYPAVADYNAVNGEGVGYLQLNTRNGLRESTVTSYLDKVRKNKNLEIRSNTLVEKILVKNKQAIGVRLSTKGGNAYEVYADKEVILSAGAINTPKLLELSGIGNAALLTKLGIPVVHDLPGVGENFQDHINVRAAYESKGSLTINDALNSKWKGFQLGLRYILHRDGLLATPSATIQAMLRSDSSLKEPDIKIQLVHLSEQGRFGVAHNSGVDKFSGFSIGAYQLFPKSVGTVHIKSALHTDDPAIRPNYLDHPEDVDTMLKAVKVARHVATQPALKRFVLQELRPGVNMTNNEELVSYMREVGQTTYHGIGTCKMGNDPMSVVDHKLRVHGIGNLRIADASVMPILVASNTNAAAIMIGEKAADIILEKSL